MGEPRRVALTHSLRQTVGDWMYGCTATKRGGPMSVLGAGLLFLVLEGRTLGRRLRAQGAAKTLRGAIKRCRTLVRFRIMPYELIHFSNQLQEVLVRRDQLILQADLLPSFRESERQERTTVLTNKGAFAAACHRLGLPHPPTAPIASDNGLLDLPPALARLERLFVKPASGRRGIGAALLIRNPVGGWQLESRDGKQIDTERAPLLRRRAADGPVVVQPVLQNHPALRGSVGATLLTIRIVTGRRFGGTTGPLSALAEIPLDGMLPLASRHLVLPVHPTGDGGGRLGIPDLTVAGSAECHPETHAVFAGLVVPCWAELERLAADAHRLLASDLATVGWDIAVTPEGPVLIEGNIGWAAAPHYFNHAGLNFAAAERFRTALELAPRT